MDIVIARLPEFLAGFKLSLQVAGLALLFGFPLGLLLSIAVQARSRLIRYGALAIVEFGRGAPALVLLQFFYFGMPTLHMTLSSMTTAVVALAWNAAAYSSEIMRAGLNGVPNGQREAALAVGMGQIDMYRFILVPQGLRIALPALIGQAILIFQATSLAFKVALPELVSRAYEIGSNTFQYFTALAAAGIFYAVVCVPASFLVSEMERRVAKRY